MASRHTLFGIFYRIGFTPSDGHALGQSPRDLVKGTDDTPALATGSALDVGCGTGDSSIYLAQHGWKVTAVDFVPKALDKAGAAGVPVAFVHADVTHLSRAGIDAKFKDKREPGFLLVGPVQKPGIRLPYRDTIRICA
jgi:SAM-dependent methyltransferase